MRYAKIGDLVQNVGSWNPAREASGQEIKYIDLGAIDNEAKRITSHQSVLADDAPSRARQKVESGDILISTVRPYLNGVAKVPDDLHGATASTGFSVVRANLAKVSPEYLFQWFKSPAFVADMTRKATGASYPAVSDRIIFESEVPLPPLDEQWRIAAILDQADDLRRKREISQKKARRLRDAYFVELFGNPSSNPKRWPVVLFGDLCKNEDGMRIPVRSSDREGRRGEYPYYGASGIIDYVDGYLFDGDRLLIGEDGANLLARSSPVAFIANGKYWVNNHAHVLASNGRAEIRFLEYFVNLIDLKSYVSGSAQPKLNQANLNRIPVPAPPLELQKRFVAVIAAIDHAIDLSSRSAKHIASLFSLLQYRAFTGEQGNAR